MTARVLEVSGQFLYLPGCMIMSFDDLTTRTAEVKLWVMSEKYEPNDLAIVKRSTMCSLFTFDL